MENNVITFWQAIAEPSVLRVFIIGLFIIIGLIIISIGQKKGWFGKVKAGKLEINPKEIQKLYESGNVHHIMNQQIQKIDLEFTYKAIERSNDVRRNMAKQIHKQIGCVSSRRALSASLRYPLYESVRQNNFKIMLRPENIKHFIDRLMRELSNEYEEYSIEIDNNTCPVDLVKNCQSLPPLSEVFEGIKHQLIEYWALPLREEQIKSHYKKLDIYIQFIPTFEQLGDMVMTRVCEKCIDKNRVYIEALKRKPEINEL